METLTKKEVITTKNNKLVIKTSQENFEDKAESDYARQLIKQYASIKNTIAKAEAKKSQIGLEIINIGLKQVIKRNIISFFFETSKKFKRIQLMMFHSGKYNEIDFDDYEYLKEKYNNDLVDKKLVYKANVDLLNKYGKEIVEAISKIKNISAEDKKKIIEVKTNYFVKKDAITKINNFESVTPIEFLNDINPQWNLKIE
jgi:hypothetical protein